jgi:eukaryotic-like serine/threonine-protein kinase
VPPEQTQNVKDTGLLNPGAKVGAYEIVSALGSGGMGVVYKARDTKLDRLVALKFLRDAERDGSAARARLLREARNVSALNHPNIATIYEVGESQTRAYIAMEFVEGRPLNAVIERDALAPETAVRYGLEISAALAHAHERGIVHRDLKPANVLIAAAGFAKVLDFGLAKRMPDAELSAATVSRAALTEEGGTAGTLLYMAPETLRGEPADARTDLWALGAVLYEMLIGHPPFEGRTAYEISSAILREPPKSFPAHVPLQLQVVIQRCLAKEREHRYQRAGEVHAALETIGADVIAAPAPPSQAPHAAQPSPDGSRRFASWAFAGGALVLVLLAWGGYELFRSKAVARPPASTAEWVQLTDFADSAVSPALSPDGKILTFIRGADTFFGEGQISAKFLPDGDPVELTHDSLMKMSPQFSPDGSHVVYTVYTSSNWDTWTVPVLGGDPRKTLGNAEGLTWIDAEHLLFSEIKSGSHMAVVTSGQDGDVRRDVYIPPRERGMAHRSAISPNRKSVLLAEMDNGGWLPCRLVPFEGNSSGKTVGPAASGCTYVAWSPDGNWMYLNSDSGGRFHIWRQRFPDGEPEQLTSGPTEEEGIGVAPDGDSLITSVGLRESTLWVRDAKGERQISSQGFAESPQFSRDGKKLFYLVRRHGVSGQFSSGELWAADLTADRTERLFPGLEVTGFDVSPDGREIVFAMLDKANVSSLWLGSIDSEFSPRRLSSSWNEDQPFWDASGNILFRAKEGNQNFVYRMKSDGRDRQKVVPDPILDMISVSPDGRWVVAWTAKEKGTEAHVVAHSLVGAAPVTVCQGFCGGKWSADGKVFTVDFKGMAGLATLMVPVNPIDSLPQFPPEGIQTRADAVSVKGAKLLDGSIVPGPAPTLLAFLRSEVHRNLYRIPLQHQ